MRGLPSCGSGTLVMRNVKTSGTFDTGVLAYENGGVKLYDCTLETIAETVQSNAQSEVDQARIEAYDTRATANDGGVAWILGANGSHDNPEILEGCSGGAVVIESKYASVLNQTMMGNLGSAALTISGEHSCVQGGLICGSADYGIVAYAVEGCVDGVKLIAHSDGSNIINLFYVDEDSSMRMHNLDYDGPGWVAVPTYGCNVDFPPDFVPCEFLPCDCPGIPTPGEDPCEVPTEARNPEACDTTQLCTDENCWPEEDGPQWIPQQVGTAYTYSGMWQVYGYLRTTRCETIGFPNGFSEGSVSETFIPARFDCLAEAEVVLDDIISDGMGGGEVVVKLYDDRSVTFGPIATLTITNDKRQSDRTLVGWDLHPSLPGPHPTPMVPNCSYIRAEIESITGGGPTHATVILRFP